MDKAFLLTKLLQCSAPFKSFETESWDILFSQPCGERTGKLIFPSHVSSGEIIQSIADDPEIISYFQQCKDIVNFSHLCLCRGVLTMVPLQALTQRTEFILSDQGKLGTLLFDALFPDLCSLCDGLKESSSCLLAFRTLTLWANHARQIAATEQCVASWLKGIFHGTSPIATRLLSYVWTAWDHPVEGVRYETKLIFEHVVRMHLIVDSVGDTFLKDLIGSLLKVGWHVRGKYGPLGCMASIVGATKMLLWFPTIPQELFPFMKERGLVPHIMDFIDKMAVSHRKEITETGKDIQEWLEVWMMPLLYHLKHGCMRMREHLAQYCIPKLLRCCPESLQYIVDHLQETNDLNRRNLGMLITFLKTARSSGLMSFNTKSLGSLTGESVSLWCGVVPVELLRKALCHLDDQIRLSALGLLCESPRTTEISRSGFHCFLCGKIIVLFLDLYRNYCLVLFFNGLVDLQEFLRWFCGFQFDSLFPGASSTRRTTALSNLMLAKQVFSFEASTSAKGFDVVEVFTEDAISILLSCLKDSYEHNKMVAFDLLKAVPPQCLPFQKKGSLCEWISLIDSLVSSPRAVDASSAAMYLRLQSSGHHKTSTSAKGFDVVEVFTEDAISILLSCLKDSYEHNKMVAFDLLKAVPPQCLPFQKKGSLREWISLIDRLVSSPRAVDASSAAMYLRLLVERCSIPLTFNMNCSSAIKDLRQLPEQWLQSLLDDLTSTTPLQALCGTRRSAGVPFFILAVVTTEPFAAGRSCFKRVMKELLQIASKPVEENKINDSSLPQVHACNILRALYRETKLGEDVFPFVSNGVVVAVKGFHSNNWAMRNSSTLLFSALVTRVFGVKRAKDEHSKENCMTGREFFSRFPELHSFLLSQLQAACHGIDRDNTVYPSLYPVLVILSRLYPSTMDGVDSVLNMSKFVPLVIGCRKSMVIKTRMISTRAVVPLVCGDLLIQTLHDLLTSLPAGPCDGVKQNQIHGTLLQVSDVITKRDAEEEEEEVQKASLNRACFVVVVFFSSCIF
ncbi:PREDICTED: thyroid adenoma-associated protein-like [Acropora digitifera]|uniref:thyroid adenoma-associated protein-like n=1 Tax=Acropora digitifera TaxID=70779 RepID=UPI00077AA68E|nr:PREDICTED: thyroid adenoma-associated protein-like [Acropora digitifera]